jgi:hypothetical protein
MDSWQCTTSATSPENPSMPHVYQAYVQKTTDYEIINLTKCNMYMDDALEPGTSLIHMLKMKIIHKSAEKIFNGMLHCHRNSSG